MSSTRSAASPPDPPTIACGHCWRNSAAAFALVPKIAEP
jgi:hypothetical protein